MKKKSNKDEIHTLDYIDNDKAKYGRQPLVNKIMITKNYPSEDRSSKEEL